MIRARYRVRARDPELAAERVAGELSTGTFTALPDETEALRATHATRVSSVHPVDPPDARGVAEAVVELEIPADNVGRSLPALYATLAGNVFELAAVDSLTLEDFALPAELEHSYPGPAFGVSGSRAAAAVGDRPLVGTIVKPSVGLPVERTAELVGELAAAGIDFVKDDELIADPGYSPLQRRIAAVCRRLAEVAESTGRCTVYAPNVTGELESMLSGQEWAARHEAGAVMVCVNAVGLAGVGALRARSALPIHGHRAGWGLLGRGTRASLGPAAHARLWRLAGVDQLHVGGLDSKFFEPDASVASSIRTCLEEGVHRPALPVVSSGQWGGQLPATVAAAGGSDFLYLAGGAIFGHPMGPAAGVRALIDAAEAAHAGVDLDAAAERSEELASTLAAFGGRA